MANAAPGIPPFDHAKWRDFSCTSECIRELALRLQRPGTPATSEEFYKRFYPVCAATWKDQPGLLNRQSNETTQILTDLGVIGTVTPFGTSQEATAQIQLPRCVGILAGTQMFFDFDSWSLMHYGHTILLTASQEPPSVTRLRIWHPDKNQDFEFSFDFWTTFKMDGLALFAP